MSSSNMMAIYFPPPRKSLFFGTVEGPLAFFSGTRPFLRRLGAFSVQCRVEKDVPLVGKCDELADKVRPAVAGVEFVLVGTTGVKLPDPCNDARRPRFPSCL